MENMFNFAELLTVPHSLSIFVAAQNALKEDSEHPRGGKKMKFAFEPYKDINCDKNLKKRVISSGCN